MLGTRPRRSTGSVGCLPMTGRDITIERTGTDQRILFTTTSYARQWCYGLVKHQVSRRRELLRPSKLPCLPDHMLLVNVPLYESLFLGK